MIDNVTSRLVAIEREQAAQKAATPLNYGQLVTPDNAPTAAYTGFVANGTSSIAALWIATFTRTDGINIPPLVDFAWEKTQGLHTYQDQINAGWLTSVTGRDKQATDEYYWSDGPHDTDVNSVSWAIQIDGQSWYWTSAAGANVSLTVTALSMVPGNLVLTRAI